jgi:hypothetical protein|tara:strand:+ start:135 stop:350 length:216 start_codon:yes stop_codon:yes gene_type:complete
MLLKEHKMANFNREAYNKVFDDLDKFKDYCRFEAKPYDEKSLYKKGDRIWESYLSWQKYQGRQQRRARNGN